MFACHYLYGTRSHGQRKGRDPKECTGLPSSAVGYPANDYIEVTGSNGVLWVTRGHGHLTDLPPVIVAKGRAMDYHRDVEADWAVSFRRASQHFLDAIEASGPAVLSAPGAYEILRVALAAGQSAQTGSPVDVTPGAWRGFTIGAGEHI